MPGSATHCRRARAVGALTVLTLMLMTTSAFAVGFQYKIANQKSQTDGDGPQLVLQATDSIARGTVTIRSKSAPNKTVRLSKMSAGEQKAISLKAPKGTHAFEVVIEAEGPDGASGKIPFDFQVTRVEPIEISVKRDGVDTGRGVIPFKVNRPLDRVEMEFFDENGGKIGSRSQSFGGRYGDLKATWEGGAEVGGIQLKAYDVDGFWTSVLLEPWWIEIEHEEIVFDTGKWTWEEDEESKLKKSLVEIREAMKKHKKHRPDMRLYVAGYTDTVGSKADNQKLSAQRARAIGKWFSEQGLDIPVYYQGFGEDAQAVTTADEIENAKNRRALYVLGNAPPPQSQAIPRANWKRVR